MSKFSRRDLLKGMGLCALGMGLFGVRQVPALAQVGQASGDIVAFYQFMLGDFRMSVISDSGFQLNTEIIGVNADAEAVASFLEGMNLLNPNGTLNNHVQILVADTGSNLVIADTGFGPGAQQGGRLVGTLSALGYSADDVTEVVITHFHPDHISGMTVDGAATFPNATYYWPQPEFDFMESQGEDSPAAGIVQGAMAQITPLMDAGMLEFYAPGDEIVPGITGAAAHGHTPGHMNIFYESNGATLHNMVDAMINVAVSTANPGWAYAFDSIPDLAAETRTGLMTSMAESGQLAFGYHFPFPGIGYFAANGDGTFGWTPAAF